jgi:hypothetical protein
MDEIPVPFVDEDVDVSEPGSAAMTIAMLVGGFAIFAMAQSIGGQVGNRINSAIGTVLGFNPATGESEGVDLV